MISFLHFHPRFCKQNSITTVVNDFFSQASLCNCLFYCSNCHRNILCKQKYIISCFQRTNFYFSIGIICTHTLHVKSICKNQPVKMQIIPSMFYDEITMRQKAILPNVVAAKYPENET